MSQQHANRDPRTPGSLPSLHTDPISRGVAPSAQTESQSLEVFEDEDDEFVVEGQQDYLTPDGYEEDDDEYEADAAADRATVSTVVLKEEERPEQVGLVTSEGLLVPVPLHVREAVGGVASAPNSPHLSSSSSTQTLPIATSGTSSLVSSASRVPGTPEKPVTRSSSMPPQQNPLLAVDGLSAPSQPGAQQQHTLASGSSAPSATKRLPPKVKEDILERRQQTQDIVFVKCADSAHSNSNIAECGSSLQPTMSSLESSGSAYRTPKPNLGLVQEPSVVHLDSITKSQSSSVASFSARSEMKQEDTQSEAPGEMWGSLAHDANLVDAVLNHIATLPCPRVTSERQSQLKQLRDLQGKLESILKEIRAKITEHSIPREDIPSPVSVSVSERDHISELPTPKPPSSETQVVQRPPAQSTPQVERSQKRLIAPGSSRLLFASPPSSVLVIKKPHASVAADFVTLCKFLTKERNMTVYVEPKVLENECQELDGLIKPMDTKRPARNIDFCITLGGDGTVLHLNALFPPGEPIPPVISFALGSLGFLTPFSFAKHRKLIDEVLNAHVKSVYVCSRMRLQCTVYRLPSNEKYYRRHLWALEHCIDPFMLPTLADLPNSADAPEEDKSLNSQAANNPEGVQEPDDVESNELGVETFSLNPLNEIIIQRGLRTSMALLDLFVDGELTTTVRADGVIVSTPTGSTGYNMSTGGPMLAPSVPAMVISPVCPHNLAFRTIVVCDSSLVRLRVHKDVPPGQALYASFDGRTPTPLFAGDSVRISMCSIRLPSIVRTEFNTEWFKSIKSKLHWNSALIPGRALNPPANVPGGNSVSVSGTSNSSK